MWSQDDEIKGGDRIKACVPYILPMLDGDQFGKYLYERIPPLGLLRDCTIGGMVNIYHQIPYLGLILFVALTLGTRFNTDMNRNLRFSAQQAALIDVALVFPELIGSGFEGVDLPRSIVEPSSNFVFYAYATAIVYCIYSNLRGEKPDKIPYISTSAEQMTGPF